MPEDCGSTTVSASIIAIAASAALPPARKISRPASLARGSADETAPRASEGASGERAAVEGATQAERSNSGSASRVRTLSMGRDTSQLWPARKRQAPTASARRAKPSRPRRRLSSEASDLARTEERRGGKGWVSGGRSRWAPYQK